VKKLVRIAAGAALACALAGASSASAAPTLTDAQARPVALKWARDVAKRLPPHQVRLVGLPRREGRLALNYKARVDISRGTDCTWTFTVFRDSGTSSPLAPVWHDYASGLSVRRSLGAGLCSS